MDEREAVVALRLAVQEALDSAAAFAQRFVFDDDTTQRLLRAWVDLRNAADAYDVARAGDGDMKE